MVLCFSLAIPKRGIREIRRKIASGIAAVESRGDFVKEIQGETTNRKSGNHAACIITPRRRIRRARSRSILRKKKFKTRSLASCPDWPSPRGPEDRLDVDCRSHLDTFCTSNLRREHAIWSMNIHSCIIRTVDRPCRPTGVKTVLGLV